jgi:uncharacterized membrane protein
MKKIGLFLLSLLIFLLIDGIWIALVASEFYANELSFIMAKEINWLAAFVFYALFVVGLLFFVVWPQAKKELKHYFLRGSVYGGVTYATYGLTNLAIIENWPFLVSLSDIVWGSFLGGATAFLAVYFGRRLLLLG